MKYHWKTYLWENGHKSTDYTSHAVSPIFIEDRLDETLDTGEIVLEAMPIATKTAFPPKTKFRLERYLTPDLVDEPKKWDFVVEHDDVEEYAGCPEICCHRIHLIEASVVAQGMHVDNIALTYELQDVDLNYKTVEPDDTKVNGLIDPKNGGYPSANHQSTINILHDESTSDLILKWREGTFINSYKYEWNEQSLSSIRDLTLNLHAGNVHEVIFNVPSLRIYGCYNEGTYQELFEINTVTRVKRILRLNGVLISENYVTLSNDSTVKYSGPDSLPMKNDSVCYSNGQQAYLRKINSFEQLKEINSFESEYTTFPAVAAANSLFSNKTVSFLTDVLSVEQMDAGYKLEYLIECAANPAYQSGMVQYYKQIYYFYLMWIISTGTTMEEGYCRTDNSNLAQASDIRTRALTYYYDLAKGKDTPFIIKGVKYSCYDLFRKALLTCDTHIIDNNTTGLDEYDKDGHPQASLQHSIVLDTEWNNRLKTVRVNETILEIKNLWEVFLQIGYYIHAIPYLEFANDGTDRFNLKFRQLGGTKTKDDTSNKITVFNSRNLSEYFTQYDSYVTNLFSPQNLCEEWVACKTSDSSFLVSNNTAEIHLAYAITELVRFDIYFKGEWKPALQYVFEKSIYEVLTNGNPSQVSPAKGNSLYYILGDNKIQGLNYVAPSVSGGDNLMALKYIVQKLFGVEPSVWTNTYTYNNLRFHVRYRTQDAARVTQIRPDIQKFVRNSLYEKYPHNEQYYGQQDKIIDSERFSANLWGRLIRVGNAVYQRQEYSEAQNEKESGDLVTLYGDTYYVVATENEYYPDAVFQKVTYSKNFNQISQVVTIPSEPRFYEVSERSKIRREVRMMEFFTLSTARNASAGAPRFLNNDTWRDFIKRLVFNKNPVTLPNYAWTRFMVDKLRQHVGGNGQVVPNNRMFPSSEIVRTGSSTIEPASPSDHSDCILPLIHYPLHNGIVFEWDLNDNFKAGDFIDLNIPSEDGTIDGSYQSMQPLRYVDIMGRADVFRFALFHKTDWDDEQSSQIPKAIIDPPEDSVIAVQGGNNVVIALEKDCREEISFNYQINLLHTPREDDKEDFLTFPNLFGDKDSPLKMCFLSESQSLFNENINLSPATVLADNINYDLIDDGLNAIEVRITEPVGINMSEVKSIVLYQEDESGGRSAYIVKNVAKLSNERKLQSWWIYPVFNT